MHFASHRRPRGEDASAPYGVRGRELVRRVLVPLGLVCASVLSAGAAVGAGSGGVADDPASARDRIAVQHHRSGLRARDKAWKYEARAESAATPEERERWTNEARSEYRSAVKSQRTAIEHDAGLYQAHASLGYALRRLGSFEAAIAAYDRALAIEPRYGEAIEYRAEACLALGRLPEVQRAYAQLGPLPELAIQLRQAIDAWVAAHRKDPGGLDPIVVEEFAEWLAGQEPQSSQTAATPGANGRW